MPTDLKDSSELEKKSGFSLQIWEKRDFEKKQQSGMLLLENPA